MRPMFRKGMLVIHFPDFPLGHYLCMCFSPETDRYMDESIAEKSTQSPDGVSKALITLVSTGHIHKKPALSGAEWIISICISFLPIKTIWAYQSWQWLIIQNIYFGPNPIPYWMQWVLPFTLMGAECVPVKFNHYARRKLSFMRPLTNHLATINNPEEINIKPVFGGELQSFKQF